MTVGNLVYINVIIGLWVDLEYSFKTYDYAIWYITRCVLGRFPVKVFVDLCPSVSISRIPHLTEIRTLLDEMRQTSRRKVFVNAGKAMIQFRARFSITAGATSVIKQSKRPLF